MKLQSRSFPELSEAGTSTNPNTNTNGKQSIKQLLMANGNKPSKLPVTSR